MSFFFLILLPSPRLEFDLNGSSEALANYFTELHGDVFARRGRSVRREKKNRIRARLSRLLLRIAILANSRRVADKLVTTMGQSRRGKSAVSHGGATYSSIACIHSSDK